MFIRVKGVVKKIIHRGKTSTTILLQTGWDREIVLRATNGTEFAEKTEIGQELDVICKIAAFTKETEYTTFYDNSIYIIDRYPNIDFEMLGGENHDREEPGQETELQE